MIDLPTLCLCGCGLALVLLGAAIAAWLWALRRLREMGVDDL